MPRAKYENWITEEGCSLIEWYARCGLTNEQIAKEKIKVSLSTFSEWIKKYPVLADALKKGKAPIDAKVENSLLYKALGYLSKETRTETNADGTTKTIVTEKWIAGDTTAQIFWLKNRCPSRWRDKPQAPGPVAESKLAEFIKATQPTEEEINELYTKGDNYDE